MHLLRTSVRGFSSIENQVSERLAEQLAIHTGQRTSASERKSWSASLPALHAELVAADLLDVELLMEYQLPLTSKRADVVLAGIHPKTKLPSYIVVELKQWSDATQFEDSETLVSINAYGARPVAHPIVQVRDYCTYIEDFTAAFSEQDHHLAGVAYLHNATDLGVADLYAMAPDEHGRLFTSQRRSEFTRFLKSRFDPGRSGAEAAEILLDSAVAPLTATSPSSSRGSAEA